MTDRDKISPFLPAILQAADEYGIPRDLFAAQGFAESDYTWSKFYHPRGNPRGVGDSGHGHGIFQIDDRTWKDWIAKNDWGNPLANARKACAILRDTKGYLRTLVSMPGVPNDLFLKTVFAAFNAGPAAARKSLVMHGDPDLATATKHYAGWIWAKAADLRVQLPELANNP